MMMSAVAYVKIELYAKCHISSVPNIISKQLYNGLGSSANDNKSRGKSYYCVFRAMNYITKSLLFF